MVTNDHMHMTKVELAVGCDRRYLFCIIKWSRYWYGMYQKFKSQIMQKYYRLAQQRTMEAVAKSTLQNDPKDVFKNMVLGINKAIDKYSYEKGTLTAYIGWWFRNALSNPEFKHTYGNAMDISSGERRSLVGKSDRGELTVNTLTVPIERAENRADLSSDPEDVLINAQEYFELLDLVLSVEDGWLLFLLSGSDFELRPEELKELKNTVGG